MKTTSLMIELRRLELVLRVGNGQMKTSNAVRFLYLVQRENINFVHHVLFSGL